MAKAMNAIGKAKRAAAFQRRLDRGANKAAAKAARQLAKQQKEAPSGR